MKKLTAILFINFLFICAGAYAWVSPEEAVNKFLIFESNGGRLTSENWNDYISNYINAPEGYDEPGWDTVIVIDSYLIQKPICSSALLCTVRVTFNLHPTKDLSGPSFQINENGGKKELTYTIRSIKGNWKLEPTESMPIIYLSIYKKH